MGTRNESGIGEWFDLHSRGAIGLDGSMRRRVLAAAAVAITALVVAPNARAELDFYEALERVDYGLKHNPSRVSRLALDTCYNRRIFAVRLYEARQIDRAERSLSFCFDALELAPTAVEDKKKAEVNMKEVAEEAAREVERALSLTPNVENGLETYRECARCHQPEGWGLTSGSVPQLAGQHRSVVIKQLADIRAGNRDGVLMLPYASVEAIGGTQSIADVAGYIDILEISVENGKGRGVDLELGERIYRDKCARCHGDDGEGDPENFVPRIQAQHYKYLVRQFKSIRDGTRRNANAEMTKQIQDFEERETHAVLDYVSRLEPPEEYRAPAGWQNPDFAKARD